jgi:hypothetical protein
MKQATQEFDYNATRDNLIQKEYGRNIQKLVKHVKSIEDRDERTSNAYALVELMKQINPAMKESPEYNQKVWDDLFIISEFDLDVDSPYKMPEKEAIGKRPKHIGYNNYNIKIKHYGRNIEILINKARELEGAEREEAIIFVGRLMKSFQYIWNKETVDDALILKNIEELSNGELSLPIERIREENLFDSSRKPSANHSGGSNGKHSGGRKNYSQSNKRRKS